GIGRGEKRFTAGGAARSVVEVGRPILARGLYGIGVGRVSWGGRAGGRGVAGRRDKLRQRDDTGNRQEHDTGQRQRQMVSSQAHHHRRTATHDQPPPPPRRGDSQIFVSSLVRR